MPLAETFQVGGFWFVGASEHERLVLRESIKRLSAEGVHSMHLRLLPRHETVSGVFSPVISPVKGLRMKILDAVIPGDLASPSARL